MCYQLREKCDSSARGRLKGAQRTCACTQEARLGCDMDDLRDKCKCKREREIKEREIGKRERETACTQSVRLGCHMEDLRVRMLFVGVRVHPYVYRRGLQYSISRVMRPLQE